MKPRLRIAALLTAWLVPAIPALADDVMDGHARRGAVYQRMTQPDLTPQACAALCDDDAMCRSWVWTRAELTGSDPGCSLLASTPTPYRAPGRVTGLSSAVSARIEATAERPPSDREMPALRAVLRGSY
ncbi:hypothetical protein AWH62_10695 [Maricaulis sp. W15]|uniref:PAN domain-containing protein n=1 Tax=Maricaulis sp. W15 TaxID=1772333 RepID=UPI0009490A29|nr:PAN domain-containing protein [Maricaulis sp. W15]OLF72295.1 hypothetical protein AWH62_10695 [Maricaulis sp. W15]